MTLERAGTVVRNAPERRREPRAGTAAASPFRTGPKAGTPSRWNGRAGVDGRGRNEARTSPGRWWNTRSIRSRSEARSLGTEPSMIVLPGPAGGVRSPRRRGRVEGPRGVLSASPVGSRLSCGPESGRSAYQDHERALRRSRRPGVWRPVGAGVPGGLTVAWEALAVARRQGWRPPSC